jgi:transposase
MLDNAPYHKSNQNIERFKKLKLPIMFLGPYHFKLAPVELILSYIKNRNLNPSFLKVSTR